MIQVQSRARDSFNKESGSDFIDRMPESHPEFRASHNHKKDCAVLIFASPRRRLGYRSLCWPKVYIPEVWLVRYPNFHFEFFRTCFWTHLFLDSHISYFPSRATDSVMAYWQPIRYGGQQYDAQANPALAPGGHLGEDQPQTPIFQGGKHLRHSGTFIDRQINHCNTMIQVRLCQPVRMQDRHSPSRSRNTPVQFIQCILTIFLP
jgi:hypothetical protein